MFSDDMVFNFWNPLNLDIIQGTKRRTGGWGPWWAMSSYFLSFKWILLFFENPYITLALWMHQTTNVQCRWADRKHGFNAMKRTIHLLDGMRIFSWENDKLEFEWKNVAGKYKNDPEVQRFAMELNRSVCALTNYSTRFRCFVWYQNKIVKYIWLHNRFESAL